MSRCIAELAMRQHGIHNQYHCLGIQMGRRAREDNAAESHAAKLA
jgi:hypothetical protein